MFRKKREWVVRFCTLLCTCGQFSDHTRLDGPGSRRIRRVFFLFFLFFFLLSILEKLKMICQRQWYKATWWMGLSYSASQSFTPSFAAILSASFLWGKPLFPSPSTFQPNSLYLSMLGQRGEKAILSELNFISLPAHTVSYDSFVVWNYNVTFFFFFFLAAWKRYSEAQRRLLLLQFWLELNLCTCVFPLRRWPADCGGVFPRMHLNETNNGSSALDHQKKKKNPGALDYLINQSG